MKLERRDFLKGLGAATAATALTGCGVKAVASEGGEIEGPGLELDEVVAGGSDDFMIARHVRLRGSNRQIGAALAKIAKERHGSNAFKTDVVQAEARKMFHRNNWPEHWSRSQGAMETFGIDPTDRTLDCTALDFNMDPGVGCSVVYYPGSETADGHPKISRNFDFSTGTINDLAGAPPNPKNRPMLADPYIVECYPDTGYPSLYICAYDLLDGCIDGVNSEGLTVALLADDYSRAEHGLEPATLAVGLSVVHVGRYVLDKCKNVEEAKIALKAAKQYYSMIPCHFIIGDRHGNSFVWEHSYMHSNEYMLDGGGKPQVITNHPLHLSQDRLLDNNSTYRLNRVKEEIAKVGGGMSTDDIKYANACVASDTPGSGGKTVWHSMYDCEERALSVSFFLGETATKTRRSDYLNFKLDV